jgi:hypothetical protein
MFSSLEPRFSYVTDPTNKQFDLLNLLQTYLGSLDENRLS